MDADAARRLPGLGRAPQLVGVDPWLNTPDGEPLRLAALCGRVVLLEFWTFACVTRPHGRRRTHFPSSHSSGPLRTSSVPWPTIYLIDGSGQIRDTQIGEGNYGRTEAATRALLAETADPGADTEAAP
jgi:hypothetical protein